MKIAKVEVDVLKVPVDAVYSAAGRTVDANWHVAARIRRGPPRFDRDNSRVADVQILHNRLACVRIDTPRQAQTTIFLLCRRGQDWVIAEKASSERITNAVEHRMAG